MKTWNMHGPAWITPGNSGQWIDETGTLRPGHFTRVDEPFINFLTDDGKKVRVRCDKLHEGNTHFKPGSFRPEATK